MRTKTSRVKARANGAGTKSVVDRWSHKFENAPKGQSQHVAAKNQTKQIRSLLPWGGQSLTVEQRQKIG